MCFLRNKNDDLLTLHLSDLVTTNLTNHPTNLNKHWTSCKLVPRLKPGAIVWIDSNGQCNPSKMYWLWWTPNWTENIHCMKIVSFYSTTNKPCLIWSKETLAEKEAYGCHLCVMETLLAFLFSVFFGGVYVCVDLILTVRLFHDSAHWLSALCGMHPFSVSF